MLLGLLEDVVARLSNPSRTHYFSRIRHAPVAVVIRALCMLYHMHERLYFPAPGYNCPCITSSDKSNSIDNYWSSKIGLEISKTYMATTLAHQDVNTWAPIIGVFFNMFGRPYLFKSSIVIHSHHHLNSKHFFWFTLTVKDAFWIIK